MEGRRRQMREGLIDSKDQIGTKSEWLVIMGD